MLALPNKKGRGDLAPATLFHQTKKPRAGFSICRRLKVFYGLAIPSMTSLQAPDRPVRSTNSNSQNRISPFPRAF